MEEIFLRPGEDYIKLGQAIKKAGLAESGAAAHTLVQEGKVFVNNEAEMRRGRKCRAGDVISASGREFTVRP